MADTVLRPYMSEKSFIVLRLIVRLAGYETVAWISFSLRISHFSIEKTDDTPILIHLIVVCWVFFFHLKLLGHFLCASIFKSYNDMSCEINSPI